MEVVIKFAGRVWTGRLTSHVNGEGIWTFTRVGATDGVLGFTTNSLDGAIEAVTTASLLDDDPSVAH